MVSNRLFPNSNKKLNRLNFATLSRSTPLDNDERHHSTMMNRQNPNFQLNMKPSDNIETTLIRIEVSAS